GTVAVDGVVNGAEGASGFAIAGTSDAIGRTATIAVMDGATVVHSYSATVQDDGTWSVTVPGSDAADLLDGGSYSVTADVSDAAGNPASQASSGLSVDETAPTIAIGTVAVDGVVNGAEGASGFAIAGT